MKKDLDVSDVIIADIIENKRHFFPGGICDPDEVRKHMECPILFDGLNREEALLILSTLPQGSRSIYISPLDKGLSTAKVFAAKYSINRDRLSRTFVIKVGPINKLKVEYDAVEQYVCPHINGVSRPVFRRGETLGLLGQDFVGLTSQAKPRSLREYVRTSPNAGKIIERLMRQRLQPWYTYNSDSPPKEYILSELFKWYLGKIKHLQLYPERWDELKTWVESETGFPWGGVEDSIKQTLTEKIRSPTTIVHGDLHSMNVLVDDGEEVWPIDFAWCHDNSSPVLDLTMLECSLKFIAIPRRADLRSLLRIEKTLLSEAFPSIKVGAIPYAYEIENILNAVGAVRVFAMEDMGLSFDDYRRALCVMTYAHSNHPQLNRSYVLGSLQVLASLIRN